MPRYFDVSAFTASVRHANFRDTRVLVKTVLGALVAINLIAAAFAFHLFGKSAQQVNAELAEARSSVIQEHAQLARTRQVAEKVGKARGAGDEFLAAYMTPRRTTYSTILAELQQDAQSANLTWKEGNFAPLEPIKGSEDLSMMTITASFDGTYTDLLKFINVLDRSRRFMIIDQLAAAPQPNGKTLGVTLKVNTFVRDDAPGAI